MASKYAYLTDDINNVQKMSVLESLSGGIDIDLITSNEDVSKGDFSNIKFVHIINKTSFRKKKFVKILLLFSSVCNSRFSILYPKRNLHLKYRHVINVIHYIKVILSKFNIIPSYSKIIEKLYKNNKVNDEILAKYDYIIFDSLLINNGSFHSILGRSSTLKHIKMIADVYSWDNVHYSSVAYFADYYFLWNSELKERLIHDHPNLEDKKFRYVGSRYMSYLQDLKPKKIITKEKYILFAAVYCDEKTAEVEKNIVKAIANILKEKFSDYKLYFRPYPSMRDGFYNDLYEHPYIIVKEFGDFQKRYHDHNEIIRVDKNLQDKIDLIYNAEVFISLGSTFTFEVGYLMKPIIQLALSEEEFFIIRDKTKTADHIIGSFLSRYNENVAWNLEEFEIILRDLLSEPVKYLAFSEYLKGFVNLDEKGNDVVFLEKLKALDES